MTALNDLRRAPGADRKANEDRPALARCSAASGASCPATRRTKVGWTTGRRTIPFLRLTEDRRALGCDRPSAGRRSRVRWPLPLAGH